jgi:hypothetical protein
MKARGATSTPSAFILDHTILINLLYTSVQSPMSDLCHCVLHTVEDLGMQAPHMSSFFLWYWGLNSHLLGRCSTTWAIPPAHHHISSFIQFSWHISCFSLYKHLLTWPDFSYHNLWTPQSLRSTFLNISFSLTINPFLLFYFLIPVVSVTFLYHHYGIAGWTQ